MSLLDRAARGAICILIVIASVGWGRSEADQRKAFIAFLQDINNRPGIHYLVPTPNDEKTFGPYLQHYGIILDFAKDMNVSMQDFIAQAIKLGFGPNPAPRTIEQIAAAPADLTAAKDAIDKMKQALETRLAKITADRGALKQPDDLKAVYDKTFDRLVVAPAVALERSEPRRVIRPSFEARLWRAPQDDGVSQTVLAELDPAIHAGERASKPTCADPSRLAAGPQHGPPGQARW
ncbi:MAG: DUF3053 family protein [Xanthobacteraceae bacterium]